MQVHNAGDSSLYSNQDEPNARAPTGTAAEDDSSTRNSSLDDLIATAQVSRPKRGRSSTLTGFDYSPHLLSLPASSEHPSNGEQGSSSGGRASGPLTHLSAFNGAALMLGVQIGAGIFSSPGVVLADVSAPGPALLVWIGSGLLAWTGAASFAELGAAIPLNGGPQAYLQYSMSPLVAFLFSWSSIVALKPGGCAAVSLVFAEYMCRVLYHTAFSASPAESVEAIPQVVIKLVAITAVALVSTLNMISTRVGTLATTTFTVVKVLALCMVMVVGIVQATRHEASESLKQPLFENASTSPSSYAIALYSGCWAFAGWDQLCYVAGDLHAPTKNLPRVIHASMGIVLTLYLIANLSYFVVLPLQDIAHSNTVALDFGKAVLGPAGGLIFALLVACSCFGNLNGDLYTSSRLVAEAGAEGFLPRFFSKFHSQRRTPIYAIALQSSLTCLFVLVGDFKRLILFSSVCAYFWYLTIIGALLLLRIKEPDLTRPYKTWITTPISFACVALFLLCMPLTSAPLEAIGAFAFILAGVPVYLVTQHHSHAGDWVRSVFSRSKFGYQPTSTTDEGEEVPMTQRSSEQAG